MKIGKKTLAVFVGVLILILFISGKMLLGGERTADAKIQTARVTEKNLSSVVLATGTVKTRFGAAVEVSSRVAGRVKELLVSPGEEVVAGQTLMLLETDELEIQLAKARADLAGAEAKLTQVQKGVRAEELEQIRNNLNQAEITLDNALNNVERQQQLYERGAISLQQLETAEKDVRSAEVQLSNLRQQVSLAENKYTAEDIAVANAQLEQARSNYLNAQLQFSYAEIKSPIDGTVASISVGLGELVGKESSGLFSILDLKRLQIDTYVDETEISEVAVGQRAEIIFDAFLQDEFTGSVVAIAPLAVLDGNAVYYVVTVYLDDIDERLRPNLTADVTIYVDERDAVLTVPNEAIVRQGGQQVVYVQNGDLFEARPVTIGWKDSKYTEVKSGLEEGEVIVVEGVQQVQVKGE